MEAPPYTMCIKSCPTLSAINIKQDLLILTWVTRVNDNARNTIDSWKRLSTSLPTKFSFLHIYNYVTHQKRIELILIISPIFQNESA